MKPWAGMSVAERGGVVGGVAAVIAALFYGAWTVSRPPVEAVGEVTATGTGEASSAEAGVAVVSEGEAVVEPEAEAAESEAGTVAGADVAADTAEAEAEAGVDAAAEGGVEAGTEGQADTGAVAEAEAGAGTETSTETVTAAEPGAEAVTVAEPEAVIEPDADVAPDAAQEVVIAPPSFDLVRVEKDGSALVAGAAMPDVTLSLRVTGEEIVAVPADGQGKFVAMFNLAPSVAPRVLSLVMVMPDGTEVAADGSVVIAPTIAPVAVAEADEPREAAMAEVGTSEAAPEPTPAPEAAPAAPAALLVTDEGAKVLQSAQDMPPELVANVTIDTITYTPEGAVQLAGRGTPERVVRLYLDNAPLSEVTISTAGDWAVTLPEVAAGIYTLRADQVDAAGAVTSRFETPFKRETVEALAAASAGEAAAVAETEASAVAETGTSEETVVAAEPEPVAPVTVTVQPGFTLWQIANEQLGAGPLYVQVFEANKDQIRDPDLIYPGQVFAIPKAE
jgi:nucleoid-associated protein YgaU